MKAKDTQKDKLTLNLNSNIEDEILNKEFSVEYKGYNPEEVDKFLDWLAIYYKLLHQELIEVKSQLVSEQQKIKRVTEEFDKLEESYLFLEQQKKVLEEKGVENVDIITRLSKLESIVNEE